MDSPIITASEKKRKNDDVRRKMGQHIGNSNKARDSGRDLKTSIACSDRLAVKWNIPNLFAFQDPNGLQVTGSKRIKEVFQQGLLKDEKWGPILRQAFKEDCGITRL